jgi:hypothetical protein
VQSLGSAFGAALVGVIVNSTGLVDPGGIAGSVSLAAHGPARLLYPHVAGCRDWSTDREYR